MIRLKISIQDVLSIYINFRNDRVCYFVLIICVSAALSIVKFEIKTRKKSTETMNRIR